jgi:hypothetical protein
MTDLKTSVISMLRARN